MQRFFVVIAALIVLGIGFGIVERLRPAAKGQRRFRAGFVTDLAWWLFTPTAGQLFTQVVVAVSLIALFAALGSPMSAEDLRDLAGRETAVTRQPLLLQMVEFLVLADFIGYWQHRAFHTFDRLWRVHAVHHSSTEVDWLSSVRVHPLNDAIASTLVAAPLLLAGFAPATLAAYLPFLTLYAIFIHANVDWDLGPLRGVISSPAFHRWHHAADAEALDKNFAGLFVFWDRLFGTLYFPRGLKPKRFGIVGAQPPPSFLGQLVYPLRSPRGGAAAAAA